MRAQIDSHHVLFRFADVEVCEDRFSVTRAGIPMPIQPKAFRVLLYLLQNPERIVSKNELLNAVWGDAAVTDNSLTRVITLQRHLLDDDPDEPRFIETVTTVGYRLVCPVERVENAQPGPGIEDGGGHKSPGLEPNSAGAPTEAVPEDPRGGRFRTSRRWLLPAVVAFACLGAAVWYAHRPLPPPRITEYIRITFDGHEKFLAGTDANRIYFSEMSPPRMAQIAIKGGETAPIPISVPGIPGLPVDVSPDGSSLLISSTQGGNATPTLWNVQIVGGTARRLAQASIAAFSPDGSLVAYSSDEGDIWLVRSDGSEPHKLIAGVGKANTIAFSPDGRLIRFVRDDLLWEMSSAGSNPHQMFPGWRPNYWQCCGRWTPDGRFYLFLTGNAWFEGPQIWALDERRSWFRKSAALPVQLTPGPLSWDPPHPGRDGDKIYAVGRTRHGELNRFDPLTGKPEPFLEGVSAEFLNFSKDGKSVTYVSYPDGTLWRADADGKNRLQLTNSSLYTYSANPRWSPDGTKIAFHAWTQQSWPSIYIASSESGSPQPLLPADHEAQSDPGWSPDGSKLVFCSGDPGEQKKSHLGILDLATHQVTIVPGSTGMRSPRWSPDGRYLAALSWDAPVLKLFDFNKEQWSSLPLNGDVRSLEWSRDGQFLYALVLSGKNQGVSRIRVTGKGAEEIINLTDWHLTGWWGYSMTLDPADAPLLLRDIGNNDIYSLTFEPG